MNFVFDDPKASFTEIRNKPLVSVVISFLNAEQFIKEAIESVLAQTYDHWELLLVDDGPIFTPTAEEPVPVAARWQCENPCME